MLAEFAHFVKEVFPSVTSATAKKLIDAAGFEGLTGEQFFATDLGAKLCQGDVVQGLTWIIERENGTYGRATLPGMLLSHSCDVDNDDWLTFAPCAPFDRRLPQAPEIKRNEKFDVYYMPPHQGRSALVADFGQVQSMRSERVLRGIADRTYVRSESLTNSGYYHLILKLTLHYLRPGPADEQRYECVVPLKERLGYAHTAVRGLARYVFRKSTSS